MSYGWRLAGDALADLRQLDPWLQEDVVDEIERVADAPRALRVGKSGYGVHDFDRLAPDARQVIFVSFHRDDANHVLTILGIAAQTRPRPDNGTA